MVERKKLEELLGDSESEFTLGEELVSLDEVKKRWDTRKNLEADYTRKTQELSSERSKLDEQRNQISPYLELHAFIQQHPEKAAEIAKILDETDSGIIAPVVPAEGVKPDQQVQVLQQRLEKLEKGITTQNEEEILEKQINDSQKFLTTEIERLEGEHPQMKRKVVLAELMSIPGLDQKTRVEQTQVLNDLAKRNSDERQSEKDSIIQDYLKEKKGQGGHKTTGGGGSGAPKGNQPEVSLDDGSARQLAQKFIQDMSNE